MITYQEWIFLVDLYRNHTPRLQYADELGKGSWYNERQQSEIEERHDVSIGAYCVLGSFAGRGCFEVNKQLRADKWVEPIFIYHDFLIRALDELPSFDYEECYRWSNIDEDGFKFLKKFKGKRILMPQFWSTSKHNRCGETTFFKITTNKKSNSRYIGEIVGKLNEQEVLFKAHTVFRIDSIGEDTIYLSEMENYSNYDLFLCEHFWEYNQCFKRSKLYQGYLRY